MSHDIVLSEPVQLAIIGVIATVVSGMLGGLGWLGKQIFDTKRATIATKRDTKATLHQVQNDHTINLRDDVDRKHDTVMKVLDRVERSIGGLHEDVRTLHERDNRMREDISILARAINGGK